MTRGVNVWASSALSNGKLPTIKQLGTEQTRRNGNIRLLFVQRVNAKL